MNSWVVYASMFALPVGVAMLLIAIVVMEIIDRTKTKKLLARFSEVYQMCIDQHGLEFAQKLYEICRHPWIGLDGMIAVFERNCGVQNDSKR